MLKTFLSFKKLANDNARLRALTPEDIKGIQGVLLNMLVDFDGLCRRNGLRYTLSGGSALGAVRHGGFIPWDEDIDIIMPRADFERLTECVDRELSEHYWVQGLETSPVCDLNFLKFRKKGTKYVEIFENEPERAGVFLDIFPLDNTYDNVLLRTLNGIVDEGLFFIASCVRMYNKQERLSRYVQGSEMERTVGLKCALGRLFSSKKDPYIWFKRCEKWVKKCKNDQSRYVAISCGQGHYFGEMYERDKLLPFEDAAFAGHTVSLMRDPDHYLKKLYGPDYMTPPPEGSRAIHSVIELDLGRPQ